MLWEHKGEKSLHIHKSNNLLQPARVQMILLWSENWTYLINMFAFIRNIISFNMCVCVCVFVCVLVHRFVCVCVLMCMLRNTASVDLLSVGGSYFCICTVHPLRGSVTLKIICSLYPCLQDLYKYASMQPSYTDAKSRDTTRMRKKVFTHMYCICDSHYCRLGFTGKL